MVAIAYRIDIAAQPDAADGESAIAFAFGDLRLLQQWQGAAARSDEDEFGRHGCDTAVLTLRREVQLAVAGVAGSGIVPAVRTLLRAVVKRFERGDGQPPARLPSEARRALHS